MIFKNSQLIVSSLSCIHAAAEDTEGPHRRLRPQQGQAPGNRPGQERHLLPTIGGNTSAISGSPTDSGGSLLQNV